MKGFARSQFRSARSIANFGFIRLAFALASLGSFAAVTLASAPNGAFSAPACLPRSPGTIARATLTEAELSAPQRVFFALKMRNFDELRGRIEKGEILSLREMTARYFPTPEAWESVAAWARANGYAVQDESGDSSRMTVFATSTVARVQIACTSGSPA